MHAARPRLVAERPRSRRAGTDEAGEGLLRTGVAPNELTDSADRDWIAGTPWHKSVPARLEPVA